MVLAVISACASATGAGATESSSIPARSTVTAVAADGDEAAYATAATATDCDRVFVWERVSRRTIQLGKKQRCGAAAGYVVGKLLL